MAGVALRGAVPRRRVAGRVGRPAGPPAAHDLVVMEELIRAGAYRPLDQVMLAAHAIIAFGTEAQKRELLPKIRRGEHVWCQLFSEPDAGSDLASLRTRAEADGDGFVVTGQKIWSTDAQWADMGCCSPAPTRGRPPRRHHGLRRPDGPAGHRGASDPRDDRLREFCEVFLDSVRLGRSTFSASERWMGGGDGGTGVRAGFVGANVVQLETMFGDLVALRRPDCLTDGRHRPRGRPGAARRRVRRSREVKLITRDTVERILIAEEHPRTARSPS